MDSSHVYALAINSSGHIFAGTESDGISRSKDNGNNWTQINSGLTSNYVRSLAINNSGYVFAGTNDSGVFRSAGTTTFVKESGKSISNRFLLSQNYPNPFNPSTTINYSVPKQSNVTLTIYDALGREVTTLISEEESIGNYSIEFNAAYLSSGIYFYRLQAGSFAETKKLILLR